MLTARESSSLLNAGSRPSLETRMWRRVIDHLTAEPDTRFEPTPWQGRYRTQSLHAAAITDGRT
jgi:hypothetical protein